MKYIAIIVLVLFFGYLLATAGYLFYEKNHKSSFGDNVSSMIYILKSELEQINNELDKGVNDLSQKEKLMKRRQELIKDIKTFYGE